jgi:hypothetical protein
MMVTCGESGVVRYHDRDDGAAVQTEIAAIGQANAFAVCPENNGIFAVGGDKSDPRIYDIADTTVPLFKAKNVSVWLLVLIGRAVV